MTTTAPRFERPQGAADMLGSLEYEIMDALWQTDDATVSQVLDVVNGSRAEPDQLAYTTVMTVLGRLHDKEFVDREKQGRGYRYRAHFAEHELVDHLGRQEVADVLDRYGAVALSQFAAALETADPTTRRRFDELVNGRADG